MIFKRENGTVTKTKLRTKNDKYLPSCYKATV